MVWWNIQPQKPSKKSAGGWIKTKKRIKQCRLRFPRLGRLPTFWELWELQMSRKASVTCWRPKCGKTASSKNFYLSIINVYVIFFLDLIQVPSKNFCKLWVFFVFLFVRFSWYPKQMFETFNTWFYKIYQKDKY